MSSSVMLFCLTLFIFVRSESLQVKNIEDDFRYISYNDLMAAGSDRFSDEGVTSFTQLLFDVARNQVFIGARDTLFSLSLRGLKLLEKAPWPAPPDKVSLCQDKGQSVRDCHNYVKVLLTDGQRIFTCGTNAFSPQCSWRHLDKLNHVVEWVQGVGKCPYNPNSNITALLTMSGQYYVGSPTDFSGSDPAIYRTLGKNSQTLRTNQYNSKWLNEPQFVGSFEDDSYVYFVFREAAVEYINCGKRIYSRIARVCKSDSGGLVIMKDNWTTFVKARLNCSVPGEYPFYYDEVQGMEYVQDQRALYATFTTPRNSIAGSAICVYNMSAIDEAFRGPFKHQDNPGSAWESRHATHSQCQTTGARSQQLAESQRYQLMDHAVQSVQRHPLHRTSLERYTHLAIAEVSSSAVSSAPSPNTGPRSTWGHVLMFVATDEGLVKKLSVLPDGKGTCVVEVWRPQMDHQRSPIRAMQYLKETDSLYIGSETCVLRVPIARCTRHGSRASCLGAQDPLCGWDEWREECSAAPQGPKARWLQEEPACPDTTSPLDGGWSSWSPWEICLQKEDQTSGEVRDEEAQDKCLCQTRKCNNPLPRNGGKSCKGITVKVSNCTVHGGWTAWSGWSACSASCGMAVKWRRRACGAPAPGHGGRLCVGADRQEIYCTQNPPCPVPVEPLREGGWSAWGAWSACSSACGGGARWRSRRCDSPTPAPGGAPCTGCTTEAEPCNRQPCEAKRAAAWTPWQLTQTGNTTEGAYVEKRFKFSCKALTTEQIKLTLSKEEERYCNTDGSCGSSPAAEASPGWSPWGPWDSCSAECGGGYQGATRSCLRTPCEGSSKMQRACNTHSCIDGWGCWGEWSACSSSCGPGRSERRRPCLAPGGCDGDPLQLTTCDGPPCESLIGWSNWTAWSQCNTENEQRRHRKCLIKSVSSDLEVCQGPDTETRVCDSGKLNVLQPLATRRVPGEPAAVASEEVTGVGMAAVAALALGALALGALMAAVPLLWLAKSRTTPPPSSPHYLTQQNSYVSVPLKEVPKKRQTSFSSGSRGSSGGLTLSKPNNISSAAMGSPKLYPKAMAGDYETATMKRNSHATHSTCRNNIDAEQDKFY